MYVKVLLNFTIGQNRVRFWSYGCTIKCIEELHFVKLKLSWFGVFLWRRVPFP